MKKIVLGTVLVLVVAIGIGVFYLLSNLDAIVKKAIETYGSEATQTAVRVNDVKIELQEGAGTIRGLTVGNPSGYAVPQAFSLGEIATRIDFGASSKELVVIDHITVRAPEVFFELNEAGQNNLNAIKRNITAGAGAPAKAPTASTGDGAEPRLIIRKILFEDGNIHATVIPLDKKYELKLPRIEMNDLGGRNGAPPDQIAGQILSALTNQAIDQVKKKGIDQYREQLEGEVEKRLEAEEQKVREKIGGEATDALKGLLKKK